MAPQHSHPCVVVAACVMISRGKEAGTGRRRRLRMARGAPCLESSPLNLAMVSQHEFAVFCGNADQNSTVRSPLHSSIYFFLLSFSRDSNIIFNNIFELHILT